MFGFYSDLLFSLVRKVDFVIRFVTSILVFSFTIVFSFAQSPLVKEWDYRFGGRGHDELTCLQKTIDGGYIIGGNSNSGISGDKTQSSWGLEDYWVVKLDSTGYKQWDKRFGGSEADELYFIEQTKDESYLLGGSSASGVSGDKTYASWGLRDYWIVKIDSVGNFLWDKRFGGTEDERLTTLSKTSDGGYILAGQSNSGISGDKTQPSRGQYDCWIVKIDSLGNKQWDKRYGGSENDYVLTIKQTTEGGFILGGHSDSGISGDKTEANWGAYDCWIIKTDSLGNKLWDKSFGGTGWDYIYSMVESYDRCFVIGGSTNSPISGNKFTLCQGGDDYYVFKIDTLGNRIWEQDFGGNGYDAPFGTITETPDSGYFVSGRSSSPSSGDKTENNLGVNQAWVLMLDSNGNKKWDKTILTTPDTKGACNSVVVSEGCYAIAIASYAGIGGDRTQDNWDTTHHTMDYWLIKFCDTTKILHLGFSASNVLCPGSCADFTNYSTNATSYQWIFPGATDTASSDINPSGICYNTPGNYDVTLIANNSNRSDTLTLSDYITVHPFPPPQGILQSGDTLFSNQGFQNYQWYHNGNIINGATNYFYSPLGVVSKRLPAGVGATSHSEMTNYYPYFIGCISV